MGTIDYSSLGNAVQRLKEGLEALGREPENTLYRDAVIQRFEFTYGLCASMLERFLMRAAAVEPEKKMAFPTLIRTASDLGVLRSGWDVWSRFRDARNLTSHVYSEETARKVLEKIPSFAEEAEFLYLSLERTATSGD
jgi:nucleotidyltransferase substrate binding protein (TIGR01987 family)